MKYRIKKIKGICGTRYHPMQKRLFRWRFLGMMTGNIIPSRSGWVRAGFDSEKKAIDWLKEKMIESYLV